MKILLHDCSGHAFQAELARQLARDGHAVTFAYFAQEPGPKGLLERRSDDPPLLTFLPLDIGRRYSKANLLARWFGDVMYGRAAAAAIRRLHPDVIVSSTTPVDSQESMLKMARRLGIPFVYSCQDLFSVAVEDILRRRFGWAARLAGSWYGFLERRQMHRSSHVLVITEAFFEFTDRWLVPRSKVTVLPNWGAINEIPVMERDTSWAAEQGLGPGTRFVYTGTLARKHNPTLLVELAHSVEPDDEVIVVASGVGAEWLKQNHGSQDALRVLPIQPFSRYPEVLGAADVLLAVIERDAARFSVPSKVLSYLCAGRPIVLAAPSENLAARIVSESGAGTVVAPEDGGGFVAAALRYASDPDAAIRAATAARAYAEGAFSLRRVADRYERLFTSLVSEDSHRA